MSISTVFAIKQAIEEAHQREEIDTLLEMLIALRHHEEMPDEVYLDGLTTLVSLVSAVTTDKVARAIMGDKEYDTMTDEYKDMEVMFNTNEEEE